MLLPQSRSHLGSISSRFVSRFEFWEEDKQLHFQNGWKSSLVVTKLT